MKRISLLMVFMLLVSAPFAWARMDIEEEDVVEARKVTKKRYFWTKTLDDLAIVGKVKHIPEELRSKVIVPYFQVTFATGGKYLNAVGGVTTSKTKIYSQLNGVDPQIMQEITDDMYADFINQLKEAGFEVLDLSVLEENKSYQKLQSKSKYPIIKKKVARFTPSSRYFPGTIAVKAFMLARDVDAMMLKADYTVNFVVLKENKKKFNILKDKSDVKVGQGINVFGEVSVITEKGAVTFKIQQPISSEKPIGEVVDATTTMNKVSDGVAFVGSLLGGRVGDRSSTNTVEVNSDNAQYQDAASDALMKSNATLTSFLAAKISGEEIREEDMDQEESEE